MRLDHEFSVPAPVDEVWQALLDPERVAPCMPGATLTEVDGDTFRGSVKVKLGPVNLLYKGSGEFQDKDEQARKVVIKASGKDARGAGTAAATVTVTLTADGALTTNGAVATDLSITGKPAQFGRGMISEVGGKLLDSFAQCLSTKLAGTVAEEPSAAAAEAPAKVATEQPSPAPGSDQQQRPQLRAVADAPGAEPIDLVDYAGASVVKRLAPVIIGLAAVLGIAMAIKAKRGKRNCG